MKLLPLFFICSTLLTLNCSQRDITQKQYRVAWYAKAKPDKIFRGQWDDDKIKTEEWIKRCNDTTPTHFHFMEDTTVAK